MSANDSTLTTIHTDFGNSSADILVAEYDVPQTKVKQTLFYKYGQLAIPKWALIPAGILTFGLLSALLAVILNSILSQSTSTVTYSQTCSKTAKCKSSVGLICGSESKCTCPNKQYWYEGSCVDQPTYTERCNQTTECRTDLGLMCAEINGQCNCPTTTKVQTCDCPSTSYWTGSTCTPCSTYQGSCSAVDTSYECLYNLYCNGTMCTCAPGVQYWNGTGQQCLSLDTYLHACDPASYYSCDATASLSCISAGLGAQCPFNATAANYTCECTNGTYWNGGSCVSAKTINAACFWNCECNTMAGLECLNMTCICPKKFSWSISSCQSQKNYSQTICTNNSQCDTLQGLTCYLSGSSCNCPSNSSIGMCDCSKGQYYDYNVTSCQTVLLYNETCYADYMCDSSLGLFCQTSVNSSTNCSCPEPIRINMCDCNMTSYWNGITCVSRLAANVSCSFAYQCQANLTCIVNETDNGIFSDVCRCPLGYYFVSGSGCVPSLNYTLSCVGSYQCYESAPLICRYNVTTTTCLNYDSGNALLPSCDCNENYFYDSNSAKCLSLRPRTGNCTANCQCISPYLCLSNQCACQYYYSSINQTCVYNLQYKDQCSNTSQCAATPNTFMTCVNNTCLCNSTGVWNGSQCTFAVNFRSICNDNSGCLGGLICRQITCIDSNKRCACPSSYYFDSVSQSCLACSGSASGNFIKYVIRYPTTDLCVAVYSPLSTPYIPFSTANSSCNVLTPMKNTSTPQLLSVHNTSELNCIANVFRTEYSFPLCTPGFNFYYYYYLGYDSASARFYDGTFGCSVSASLCSTSTQCLTFCSSSNTVGSLNLATCSGTSSGFLSSTYIGAICDYRVN